MMMSGFSVSRNSSTTFSLHQQVRETQRQGSLLGYRYELYHRLLAPSRRFLRLAYRKLGKA